MRTPRCLMYPARFRCTDNHVHVLPDLGPLSCVDPTVPPPLPMMPPTPLLPRSSSPDPWGGLFRTSTPGPEALLQSFLHPTGTLAADLNALSWLKSATPPLTGGPVWGGGLR